MSRRVAPLLVVGLVLAASCSSSVRAGQGLRPPASLYLLPSDRSLPAGVHLWEAHLFTGETELIFLDRPACDGGHEFRLMANGRPAGVKPRPYTPPGPISNGGGVCDYAAGPRPSDAVDHFNGSTLYWAGPAGNINATGSVDSQTLTAFVRGLRAVSEAEWIAYARQAPHRSSQGRELGPDS